MTIDSHTASTVDVNAKATGSLPAGVTIVTVACADGTMHGVTVNSKTADQAGLRGAAAREGLFRGGP